LLGELVASDDDAVAAAVVNRFLARDGIRASDQRDWLRSRARGT
jgi:hypothetical protein